MAFAPSSPNRASILWHDYETTGTNKQLDRPTQFASVRTDLDLNILDEEVMLYCKPSAETLMGPVAAAITGQTPQECDDKGMIEAEFCREVLNLMSQKETCGCGYNTISFDDEVSRNLFFRNFQDPYGREWQNGNSRWDLISAVRLFAALRPDGIVWPVKDDGRPSQRLEDLSRANNLKQDRAHDALSDVYATIQLAQLLKKTNAKLWEHAFGLREKGKVQLLANLKNPQRFVHVAPYHARGGTAVMFPLVQHPTNKNGVIVVDLGSDLSELLSADAANIASRLFGDAAGGSVPAADKAEAEKQARLPVNLIQINKAPPICQIKALRSVDYERLGYSEADKTLIEANERLLLENPELSKKLSDKLAEAYRISSARFDAPAADAELAIYGKFPSSADKATIKRVQQASPDELAQGGFDFEDRNLTDLLFRFRARNWPETLSASEQAQWHDYRKTRLTTQTPATTITIQKSREEIARLSAEPEHAGKTAIFEQLSAWLDNVEAGLAQAPAARPATRWGAR